MAVNTIESYEVNGKLYVNTKFLSTYFNKSEKQVGRWKKDGLTIADKPNELIARGDFYFLDEAREWVDKNINKTKSRATQKRTDTEIEIDTKNTDSDIEKTVNDIQGKIKLVNEKLQIEGTGYEEAERISKIIDALTKTVKLGEQTKDLIPKKDTEKVIIEFIITLIAGYKKDIKILPKELARRDEKTIKDILENNYKSSIAKYQKMAKSKIVSEGRLYDVVEVVFSLLQDEVEVDEIIKRLERDQN